MQKKFIYLIAGLVVFFLGLILFIILTTAKPVVKVVNPLDDAIAFASLSSDGQSFYYYNLNYKLIKWNIKDKTVETIVEFPFQNFRVDNINYSPDKKYALVYWNDLIDSTYKHTILVDFENKTTKAVSKYIFSNAWSPDSKQIAAQFYNESENKFEIVLADPDAKNLQKISNFNFDEQMILWPNHNTLVYYELPLEFTPINVTSFDIPTKTEKTILSNISPDLALNLDQTNKFILSFMKENDEQYHTSIFDLETGKNSDSSLAFDISKSALLNSSNIIAAIRPDNQKTDDIIKINTSTGKTTSIRKKLPFTVDATNLEVSTDGKYLYFISNTDLYKLKL
jgi:hypothetical protein